MAGADRASALRGLPSVDQLIRQLAGWPWLEGMPRARLTVAVREALEAERRQILEERAPPSQPEALAGRIAALARRAAGFSLRPVLNAAGVVLHAGHTLVVLGQRAHRVDSQERARQLGRGVYPKAG